MKSRGSTGSISRAQALDRVAMDAREQVALAPFVVASAPGREAAAHHEAFGLRARRARRRRRARGSASGAASAAAVTGPEPVEARAHELDAARPRASTSRRANSAGAAIARRAAPRPGYSGLQLRQPLGGDPERRAPRPIAQRASRGRSRASASSQRRPAVAALRASASRDAAERRPAPRASRRRCAARGQASSRTRVDRRRRRARPRSSALSASRQRRLMHGLRAALFQRRVVEEGVRPRVEDLGASGDGAARSRATTVDRRPLRCRAAARSQPVDVHRLVQAVVAASARPADGRASRARRRGSRRRRPGRGTPRPAGPRRACAAAAAAPCLPPRKRGSASAVVAFQRQRTPNIGASSSACTSTSRAVAECR